MFTYEQIGEELKARTQVKTNNYDYIIAAKITTPALYSVLKYYYSAAKNINRDDIDGHYEGEDWYFFEGYAGDQFGPSTYHLESLTHKKKKFEKFCAQFD